MSAITQSNLNPPNSNPPNSNPPNLEPPNTAGSSTQCSVARYSWFTVRIRRLLGLTKDRVGRWGEQTARIHITKAGLITVQTNWRGRSGELDLIALDKRTLVIIEVKTRHISLKGEYPAIAAITHDKRQRLESLGRSFQRNHGPFCRRHAIKARRTDVIEVYYSRNRWGILRCSSISWHCGVPLT